MDGFSRKILWLKLSSTNQKPQVIAKYFLECIESVGGCPSVVRGDHGTENAAVAKMQIAFRINDGVGAEKSFLYGASTSNTRIESLWGQWRRSKCHWWIELCRGLRVGGLFDKDNCVHRYSLAFVFGPLVERDCEEFLNDWNSHHIRADKHVGGPSGRPDDLFDAPEMFGRENQLHAIDCVLWARCMIQESANAPPLYPATFEDYGMAALQSLGMTKDSITHRNCRRVYLAVVELLDCDS